MNSTLSHYRLRNTARLLAFTEAIIRFSDSYRLHVAHGSTSTSHGIEEMSRKKARVITKAESLQRNGRFTYQADIERRAHDVSSRILAIFLNNRDLGADSELESVLRPVATLLEKFALRRLDTPLHPGGTLSQPVNDARRG